LTDSELDAAFTKADTDADGKLSLDELKKYLVPVVPENPPTDPVTPGKNDTQPVNNNTEPIKNETIPEEPVKNETESAKILPANATDQEVKDFFTTADTDADGFLTKEEIKAAFTA
jgi:Ca2+-binding EF-hand superfamily protein